MKKFRLELIIIILSLIVFISIFEEVNPLSKQSLDEEIVEYDTPEVTQTMNGSEIYITGIMRDDSPDNFDDVFLNVYGIGEQGQTISSKTIEINRMNSNSNEDYNVTLENDSIVVAGDVRVINATKIM